MAEIAIFSVSARGILRTRIIETFVHVFIAINSGPFLPTLTVVGPVCIQTSGTIFTGRRLTLIDIRVTMSAGESLVTSTEICFL